MFAQSTCKCNDVQTKMYHYVYGKRETVKFWLSKLWVLVYYQCFHLDFEFFFISTAESENLSF